MADEARSKTDKRLERAERELTKIYQKSAKGIYSKWNKYMNDAAKKIKPLQDEYDKAKQIGDKDLIKETGFKLGQAKREITLQNEHYKSMLAETTKRLAEVNQTAVAYLNKQIPDIYALNYNAISGEAFDMGVQFGLVDAHTVKRLVIDGKIELPYKDLDIPKDMRWNKKQLNSAVLQGILQGDSINKIAKRIVHIVDNNASAAIKNARTMVTGAECRGREDSYRELGSRGVVLKKVWIATPDNRTRESHLELDGEEVDVNEAFSNGCMYPGDPSGDPSEVYNCRCSIRTHIIGFRANDGSISEIDFERGETLHDKQMEEEKERREIEAENNIKEKINGIFRDYNSDFAKYYGEEFYNSMCDLIDKCDNEVLKDVWQQYQSKIKVDDPNFKGRAHCTSGSIYVDKTKDANGSSWKKPYETTFHESGHAIDYLSRQSAGISGSYYMYSHAYKNGAFTECIRNEVAELVALKDKELKAEFKAHKGDYEWMFKNKFIESYQYNFYKNNGRFIGIEPKYSKSYTYSAIEEEIKSITGGPMVYANLSDILEGATNGKISCGIGHGKSYWKLDDYKLATETFAEMTSATIANNESLEIMKHYLPKSYNMYNDILKDMATKGGS